MKVCSAWTAGPGELIAHAGPDKSKLPYPGLANSSFTLYLGSLVHIGRSRSTELRPAQFYRGWYMTPSN